MVAMEPTKDQEKLKHRYQRISKLIFLFALIYVFWVAIVLTGTYFLGLGFSWAAFTVEQWVFSAIILFVILILLEVFFFLHLFLLQPRRRIHRKEKKPEVEPPQFIQGMRVHNFTIPFGAKGGIFSKTYIKIDPDAVLNLRYQITPPNELWGKQP